MKSVRPRKTTAVAIGKRRTKATAATPAKSRIGRDRPSPATPFASSASSASAASASAARRTGSGSWRAASGQVGMVVVRILATLWLREVGDDPDRLLVPPGELFAEFCPRAT